MGIVIDKPFGVDTAQAQYWQSPVSRLEVQKNFDEQAIAINTVMEIVGGRLKKDNEGNPINPPEVEQPGIVHALANVNLILSFFMEKNGYKLEDIMAWGEQKKKEQDAAQAAAAPAEDLGRTA